VRCFARHCLAAALFLSYLLSPSSSSAANPAYSQTPDVAVRIYDFADVPASTLTIAEEEARFIFAQAGVATACFNCRGRDERGGLNQFVICLQFQ
jgi:hypothetical protein